MYAVIRVGTSQERVTEGQLVRVDKRVEENGAVIEFEPVLLVDGDSVLAGPALKGAKVTGTIVGVESGPKIRALTYKAKSIQRRRWGHRQWYTTVRIDSITGQATKATKAAKAAAPIEV